MFGVLTHCSLRESADAKSETTPGVYFVRPSAEKMAQIAGDVSRAAYESFHVYMSGPAPDACLEHLKARLPKELPQLDCEDVHFDFLALGAHVFELGFVIAIYVYSALHDGSSSPFLRVALTLALLCSSD